MSSDELFSKVVSQYTEHINPYLAKLMQFAGFGVEVKGEGVWMWDQDGRKYLDCLGGYGVFSLGHRHPKVVEAVKAQLDQMPLSGKTFFNPKQAELSEKISKITPAGLEMTFFSNSGAEACEAALKFARAATRRTKIVSTIGGYHGKTMGGLSATGREKYRKPFEPLVPGVTFVEFGDLEQAQSEIDEATSCMIVEPIQGEGGVHIPPKGYLAGLREACTKVGAMLIVDEVQTGLGRTGKFFGCMYDGVVPDIMPLAKALGGGVMPIGATVMTPAICEAVYSESPLIHTSTFGGNPLACAAGVAAIEVIENEGLCDTASSLGHLMISRLKQMQERHDLIADVRGQGLLIGVEFSMDEVGELVIAQLVKRGMIAAYTLNNPRVIRLEPPLIITEEQVNWACDIFEEAVAETSALLAVLI